MDKETLSNYGWIVVLVLVLAVMLALATPFGSFIAGAIKSTTAGLFNVNQAALGSAGIDVNDMVFENCDHVETEIRNATDTYTGDTCCKGCGAVLQAGQTVRAKVPEGGKYTAADGTVYNPGDEMPETVTTGDLYEYGDYVYRYNQEFEGNSPTSFSTNESLNGWGVRWIGNKSIPTEILTSINGMPIASMQSTFSYSGITAIPEIPDTVVNLHWAFSNTHKLSTDASNITIPSSVVNMEQAFCSSAITKGPDMSEAVNVTNLKATFWMCKSLTEAPDLSNCNKLTSLQSTFADCISITDLSKFVFPENASYLYCTFSRCTNLVTAPVIPSTGSTMYSLFAGCTSLTGIVEINTEKDYYYTMCFQGVDFETQNLTLTGTATFLDKVGATGTNYCAECNGCCKGGH